jgi:hypothetical protein
MRFLVGNSSFADEAGLTEKQAKYSTHARYVYVALPYVHIPWVGSV